MEKIWVVENKTSGTGQVMVDGVWVVVAPRSRMTLSKEPFKMTKNLRKVLTFKAPSKNRFGRNAPSNTSNASNTVINAADSTENKVDAPANKSKGVQ